MNQNIENNSDKEMLQSTQTYSRISEDTKQRAVIFIQANPHISIAEVGKNFTINEQTLHYIWKKFIQSGSVAQSIQKGGPRNIKVEPTHIDKIQIHIEENPIITIVEIKTKLFEETELDLSIRTIFRIFNTLNITHKLTRLVSIARNSEKNIQERFLIPFTTENVVYVDETGFNLHIRRSHGRSRGEERVNIVVANSRGRNISVCSAMRTDGLIHNRAILGAYNAREFIPFLQETCERIYLTAKFFVMDNLRFHHSKEVVESVEALSHRILFLPTYSVQLNPIELLFSKWKIIIKSNLTISDTTLLLEAINTASSSITQSDCIGWIHESTRYASRAIQRENF